METNRLARWFTSVLLIQGCVPSTPRRPPELELPPRRTPAACVFTPPRGGAVWLWEIGNGTGRTATEAETAARENAISRVARKLELALPSGIATRAKATIAPWGKPDVLPAPGGYEACALAIADKEQALTEVRVKLDAFKHALKAAFRDAITDLEGPAGSVSIKPATWSDSAPLPEAGQLLGAYLGDAATSAGLPLAAGRDSAFIAIPTLHGVGDGCALELAVRSRASGVVKARTVEFPPLVLGLPACDAPSPSRIGDASLGGLRNGWRHGVTGLEVDVNLSADGAVICEGAEFEIRGTANQAATLHVLSVLSDGRILWARSVRLDAPGEWALPEKAVAVRLADEERVVVVGVPRGHEGDVPALERFPGTACWIGGQIPFDFGSLSPNAAVAASRTVTTEASIAGCFPNAETRSKIQHYQQLAGRIMDCPAEGRGK